MASYTILMLLARIAVIIALLVILGVPFALRPAKELRTLEPGQTPLVVITPHVPQIQEEFSRAFDAWHRRHYGAGAAIDWRQPGGTTDILKVLSAHYEAAAREGRFDFSNPANPTAEPGACAYDVMLGGGSYEHTRLKQGVQVEIAGVRRILPMSEPAGFPQARLDAWFGDNQIGAQHLYDPEQYWLGTALSGFGIVYNREVLDRLGIPEPCSFRDVADPRLRGWVTLADPRQSGSVATLLDSILSREGWERGWRLIREMCANARTFTSSSPRPPIDVSHGEAAMGLAIDFYGRGQSQAVAEAAALVPSRCRTREDRVGYVDPIGETYIDADPVSILRAGPNPVLARRFVEFCLSEEGQSLWQFPPTSTAQGANNPRTDDGRLMGPARHALRRMPVRRIMYEKYAGVMMDKVRPWDAASGTLPAGWRAGILVMMGAFAVDNAHDLRAAWAALNHARQTLPSDSPVLAEMERLFHAFPETEMPDGTRLSFTPQTFGSISTAWKSPMFKTRCEIAYTNFFRENYRRILSLAQEQQATRNNR
jgi:iron(III) transport system substrate-binding protein